MAKIKKGVYKTKSSPASNERKLCLIGKIRAKAADMAKKSADAHHQLPCPNPEGCKHFKDATKQINYKGITEVINEIIPYRNFTERELCGFQMAKASILIELKKYCENPKEYLK